MVLNQENQNKRLLLLTVEKCEKILMKLNYILIKIYIK
jgi:hypothetical protein